MQLPGMRRKKQEDRFRYLRGRQESVTIANIGDQPHRWHRTYGHYFITVHDPAKPWSLKNGLCVLSDTVELVDQGDDKSTPQIILAQDIAADFLNDDKVKRGVFLCSGTTQDGSFIVPAEKEIGAAKERLTAFQIALIEMGDTLYLRYRDNATNKISDEMRRACAARGVVRDWSRRVQDMKECPNCGFSVPVRVVMCSQCKYVFDEERYRKMKFAGVENIAEPVAEKPARGRKEAVAG